MVNVNSGLGIEIRGDDVVFTVVKKRVNGFAASSSQVIENFLQLDKAQLRQKIQQIRRHNGFNRENIVLGLPRNQVILRQLEFPLEAIENLEQLVKYQVEYYLPSEEGTSYFDHVILKQDLDRKKILLQVAMVRKGWLDPYIERLWTNKLPPSRVELSTSALFNLVSLKKELLAGKDLVVVFDINDPASEVVVLQGRENIFSRELNAGESTTVEQLLDQLQQLLSQVKVDDGTIDRFYFTGTHGNRLYHEFKQRFKETELLADALKGRLQLKDSTRLSNSVGLALSSFRTKKSPISLNLVPPARRRVTRKVVYVPTIILTLMVIAGVTAYFMRDYFQGQEFANQLDARIRTMEPKIEEVKKLQKDIDATSVEILYLEELTKGRSTTLEIMKELTEKLPQEAYLQMMTIDSQARRVDITGYSSNPTAIQNVLLKSAHLQKVENKYTTYDQRVKKERFNFVAEIRQ